MAADPVQELVFLNGTQGFTVALQNFGFMKFQTRLSERFA